METPLTRFATVDEVMSNEFMAINKAMDEISVRYMLADHSDVNAERYPWSQGLLNTPAFYASRLWEYPFSIISADLKPAMKAADIGCGMTAFTVYLKEVAGCDVIGADPDLFDSGTKYKAHGVSREFVERTGLKIVHGDMDELPLETDSQDRVFCISVMEHVPPDVRRRGMQEIARVLKPGGRAVLTVDMSMWFELNRPLDLVWDSGLAMAGAVDLRWPTRRFGMFSESRKPADVLGLTLTKDEHVVETEYRTNGHAIESVPGYKVPALIPVPNATDRPLWWRVARRAYHAVR